MDVGTKERRQWAVNGMAWPQAKEGSSVQWVSQEWQAFVSTARNRHFRQAVVIVAGSSERLTVIKRIEYREFLRGKKEC